MAICKNGQEQEILQLTYVKISYTRIGNKGSPAMDICKYYNAPDNRETSAMDMC